MTAKGDCKRIKAKIERMKKEVRSNLQAVLSKVGEDAIAEARRNGSYNNITGNLRNSIGYAVVSDGAKVGGASNGGVSPISGNGTDKGASESGYKTHVEALVDEADSQLQLIVVAGMEYAPFVEHRGKNVLQSAKTMVEKTVPRELEELRDLMAEKFNK